MVADESSASSRARESDAARAWREWATARLVPVVVHRANNAVAAQLGAADLVAREPERSERHLDEMHRGAQNLGELLSAFSRFSKAAPRAGEADLARALGAAEPLLAALLSDLSGELVLEPPRASVAVSVPGERIEQLVVALAASALLPADGSGRVGGPRCRIAVTGRGPAGVSVRIALDRPLPERIGDHAARDLLCALERELEGRGGALRARSGPSRCAFRLDLPAAAGAESLGGARAPRERHARRRVLVHLAEPMLAELVKSVLAECGVDAELASRPEDLVARLDEDGWHLYLLEIDGLDPALLERCRARPGALAVLTAGAPPDGSWRGVLPMPFRPKELMDFVGRSAFATGVPGDRGP